jgi:hypothetical protein
MDEHIVTNACSERRSTSHPDQMLDCLQRVGGRAESGARTRFETGVDEDELGAERLCVASHYSVLPLAAVCGREHGGVIGTHSRSA